ncbi:Mu transposase C-terminal domain-containing protein [Alkalicella caledoniensis]|uniref:Mu transposase C-terminal domain-containing protein n=1 Tax=Alkalicella caledoniensis TaxID=2731377 RepID=A0A7G9W3W3_ALKCA|nr:Mu transposase C-terminal domain-containing protein [Alkalicella caledoniensis]QNO13375.1 Mu transposase C-terminal domain-containing protein [Alkalicella caledoniensis]
MNSFVENNYNKKVHSSIKMAPIDRFKEDMQRLKLIPSKQEIDNIFMYRATRKVKNDATLSIDNILFEVPMKYIGDKVNVRFLPTALDKAFIFSEEGKLLDCIYPVDKVVNSKIIRDHNLKPIDFSAFTPQIKEDISCTKLIMD